MKYKVEVGSLVTRLCNRQITVNAKNEEEAAKKAIEKYEKLEYAIAVSVDPGTPQVDYIEELDG